MSELGLCLPPFDPRWPIEIQQAFFRLASRRIEARRGVADASLDRALATFTAAIAALPPPHRHDTEESATMPASNGDARPPHVAPAVAASTFNAAQWESLTTAARDHATSEIKHATAQRALLTTEITQLEQTAAALDRALCAFRELPPPITALRARRRPGYGLSEALEWADTHGGILDMRLFAASAGRSPIAHSTIRRLVTSGQLVHIGGPKSGRYQRPTLPAPPAAANPLGKERT